MNKPNTLILRVIPDLRPSVDGGHKTIEIRIETDSNRWIIEQILQYKKGDRLIIEYYERGSCTGSTEAVITGTSEEKILGELTEEEVSAISGLLGGTRDNLIQLLNMIYRKVNVNKYTKCHLVHFALKK